MWRRTGFGLALLRPSGAKAGAAPISVGAGEPGRGPGRIFLSMRGFLLELGGRCFSENPKEAANARLELPTGFGSGKNPGLAEGPWERGNHGTV